MTDPRNRAPLDESELKRFLEKTPMLDRLTEHEHRQIEHHLMMELRRLKHAKASPRGWTGIDWRAAGIAAAVLLTFCLLYLHPFPRRPPVVPSGTGPAPTQDQGLLVPAEAVGPPLKGEGPRDVQAQFPGWAHPSPAPATGTLSAPTRTQINWAPKDDLCGPNSLWIAAQRLGVQADLDEVIQASGIGERGATLWNLKLAAEQLGLHAEGVRMTWDELCALENPAVLFVRPDHFVCVDPSERDSEMDALRIHDLPLPASWITREGLESKWSGETLVLSDNKETQPPSGPCIDFATLYSDFGVEEGTTTLSFPFRNIGGETLDILDIHKSCGCASVSLTDTRIPSGGEGTVLVALDLSGHEGTQNRTVEVLTNDPLHPSMTLRIHGFTRSSIRVSTERLNFGDLNANERSTRGFALFDRFDGSLEVTGVEIALDSPSGTPPKMTVRFERADPTEAQAKTRRYSMGKNAIAYWVEMNIEVSPETSRETFTGTVSITTDAERSRAIAVPFRLNVPSDYYTVPEKVYFGMVHPGEDVSRRVVVRRRSGEPVQLEGVDVRHSWAPEESLSRIRVEDFKRAPESDEAKLDLVMASGGGGGSGHFEMGVLELKTLDGAILRVPWTSILADER